MIAPEDDFLDAISGTFKAEPPTAPSDFSQKVKELTAKADRGEITTAQLGDEVARLTAEAKQQRPSQPGGATPPAAPSVKQGETPEAAPLRDSLGTHFAEQFAKGKAYPTINEARREAGELLKGDVQPGTPAAKHVDEAVEIGVVRHAGDIVKGEGTPREKFDRAPRPLQPPAQPRRPHQHEHRAAGVQHARRRSPTSRRRWRASTKRPRSTSRRPATGRC
jgi:hypothetical protein